jgi:hypothetical protein
MDYFWEAFVILAVPVVLFHWLFTIMVMSPKLTIKHLDYGNRMIVACLFYFLIFTPLLSRGLEEVARWLD